MKKAKRILQQARTILNTLKESENIYIISTDDNPKAFMRSTDDDVQRLKAEYGKLGEIIISALLYKTFNYPASGIRSYIILNFFNTSINFKVSENSFLIYDTLGNKESLEKNIQEINTVFKKEFNTTLQIETTKDKDINILLDRINEVEKFYIEENGAWIQNFLDNLGDELSKTSFRTFLEQRIKAHINWESKAHYPIDAPIESFKWREDRLANPPALPVLNHCPLRDKEFFFLHTFILEQYAISNVVEAEKGDIVIDAGAFIADTALYFANKIGQEGKVYAFEVFPESIIGGNDNLEKNNVHNVEMLQYALSDKQGKIYFKTTDSTATVFEDSDGDIEVETITLDSFIEERNISKIDFIKSDIEGAEMAFLKGAKKSITQFKPKCGIALYHKQEDFIVIPKLLQEYCPEYTFYFRCEAEPVLLAKVQ